MSCKHNSMLPKNWIDMLQDWVNDIQEVTPSDDPGSLPDDMTDKDIEEYIKAGEKRDK